MTAQVTTPDLALREDPAAPTAKERPGAPRSKRPAAPATGGGSKRPKPDLRAARPQLDAVIEVDGTLYAIGLFWQVPESGGSAAVSAEARRTAKSRGTRGDLFAVRDSVVTQYAIAQTSRGHRSNMPVAATALAEASLNDTFAAFFPLPDGRVWYARCVNDIIRPEDDAVLDEADAFELARAMVEEGLQGALYAPAQWDLQATHGANVDSRSLAQIIGPTHATTRLQYVSYLRDVSPKVLISTVSLIVGLVIFFVGAYFWIDQRQQADVDAILKNWPPAAKYVPKATPTVEARKLEQPKPWTNVAPFAALARSCIQSLQRAMIPLPGYAIEDVRCTPGNANAIYRRTGGTAAWLDAWLSSTPHPVSLTIDHKTDRVTITEPVKGFAPRGPQPLWQGRVVYHNLTSLLQMASSTPSIVPVPPPPPPADPKDAENAPPPPPPAVRFSAKLNLPPDDVIEIVDRIPGAMFTEVEFDTKARQWSLNGVIYHEP